MNGYNQTGLMTSPPATGAKPSSFGRGLCVLGAYISSLFALCWGFASFGLLADGSTRGTVFGTIGVVFTALMLMLDYLCLSVIFGWRPLFARVANDITTLHSPEETTLRHEIKASKARGLARLFGVVAAMIVAVPTLFAGGHFTLLAVLILLFGPFVAFATLRQLLAGNLALAYDAQGVTIPGFFGTKRHEWRDITEVDLMKRTIYYMHVIPIRSVYHVYLKERGGLFGTRKVYLPLSLTGMTPQDMKVLALNLKRVHAMALGAV